MCTRARPPRTPTGRPLHDPSRGHHLPSFPQGLQLHLQGHWTSVLFSGVCFLRHMALSPQKPLFPLWESQDMLHISISHSIYLEHSEVTSLPADFFFEMA